MNKYYQEHQNHSSEEPIAQLTVTVSKDQEYGYTCDWDSDDNGIRAISSIFYGIAYDDLIEKILNELKTQCVLEGNEEDFLSIVQSIKDFVLSKTHVKDGASGDVSGESLAVSPRDVLKL